MLTPYRYSNSKHSDSFFAELQVSIRKQEKQTNGLLILIKNTLK